MIRDSIAAAITGSARGFALLLVTAALTLPSLATAAPHVRAQSWFIGFAASGGSADIDIEGLDTDREGGAGGSFRGGYAFTDQLGFGLESNAWVKEEDDVTFTFSMAAATLYLYPAQGLVLRGGIGVGSGTVEVELPGPDLEEDEQGFGVNLGAAYEFRVGRTFTIGPQVDFAWMSLDEVDANYVNGGLSFTWYFVPR